MGEFNLESYLSDGVENIVKGAMKASLKNPKESLFMAQYAVASIKARELRSKAKEQGEHIPPFLIASITSKCNLHCVGCYARANHACHDEKAMDQLTDMEWKRIFLEAKELGIGFVLLAGGEPLVRKDVITAAASIKSILFPIFTNATMIDEEYLRILKDNRNLVPIISVEGNEETTNQRRGQGVYKKIMDVMDLLDTNGVLFGASVTVTKKNLQEVTSESFIKQLYQKGCKVVIYVEYVPVDPITKDLAPHDAEREHLKEKIQLMRSQYEDMLFISFPGDEKSSGGCLAAGRGFFHINSHGGAEPCPFSPYSDTNLKNTTLKEALHSPLFLKLQSSGALIEDHAGGCVLYEREELVKEFIS